MSSSVAAAASTDSSQSAPIVAAQTSTDDHPSTTHTRSHIPTTSTDPTPPIASVLQHFLNGKNVQLAYATAIDAYKNAHKALRAAEKQLHNLQSKQTTSSSSVSLPRSLKLSIVERVLFIPVAGDEAFYRTEIDTLAQLEADASKKIYEVIVQARKKHIAHLKASLNSISYITQAVVTHTSLVNEYAKIHDRFHVDASRVDAAPTGAAPTSAAVAPTSSHASFPIKDATAHFESSLRTRIDEFIAVQLHKQLDADTKAKAARDTDLTRQEKVAAGTHNGENISTIATNAAEKALMPLQQQVDDLAQLQKQSTAIAPRTATAFTRANTPKARDASASSNSRAQIRESSFNDPAHSVWRIDVNSIANNPSPSSSTVARTTDRPSHRDADNKNRKRYAQQQLNDVDNNHGEDSDRMEIDGDDERSRKKQARSRSQSTANSLPFYRGGAPHNTQNVHRRTPVHRGRSQSSIPHSRGGGGYTNRRK